MLLRVSVQPPPAVLANYARKNRAPVKRSVQVPKYEVYTQTAMISSAVLAYFGPLGSSGPCRHGPSSVLLLVGSRGYRGAEQPVKGLQTP